MGHEISSQHDAAPPSGRFGLRLAFWYAAVFVASSLAIVLLTYTLLASSLAERDRQIVASTLREYSVRYAAGGLSALARAVESRTAVRAS